MKILVVDDELDILELITEEFTRVGHIVECAVCGQDAIAFLKHNSVDVVLSDYRMPNGTGMDVLRFVKKLKEDRPYFFFISGHSDISPELCILAGAEDFFPKPYSISDIVERIECLFKN